MLPKHRAPIHPGEILDEEFLKPMRVTQTKLAAHLSWPHAKVNELIHGKRGVTPAVALALSDALGTSAELWMNLQTNYDLWQAMQEHKKRPKLAQTG
ncbi:MAG: HigA family addiction module antidote protein [Deltaproteobacteria bacterium]|nr:HigA family addiction module antidote protein [Deltaproteobacteria bacterium]MBI3293100.1 HigA family addiction module antidote protein [Deltaproteobacteria bacterium]